MAFKFTLYRPTCISTWHSLELLTINNKQVMNILLFRFDENMVLQEYSFKNRTTLKPCQQLHIQQSRREPVGYGIGRIGKILDQLV